MQIFDPIARDNAANTTNDCQMMSYSNVEKDINRNEHINLKTWINRRAAKGERGGGGLPYPFLKIKQIALIFGKKGSYCVYP